MLLHLQRLLQLVVVDDVLVGGTALREGVQLVHVVHVAPEGRQLLGDVEVDEVLRRHADVLQPGHQFAVEAAHGVARQEAGVPSPQVLVDPLQVS